MGVQCSRNGPEVRQNQSQTAAVTLHVYDIGMKTGSLVNRFLKPFGTGAFHCGVEVYGWEWSYSDIANPMFKLGTGVFSCRPRLCEGHTYCESVPLSKTHTPEPDVLRLIGLLEKEWPVRSYDLLKHNCCHFCDELCRRLGVGGLPAWITSLAAAGASIIAAGDITDMTVCRMVALEVAESMSCCRGETVAYEETFIEAIPVLPRDYSRETDADATMQ